MSKANWNIIFRIKFSWKWRKRLEMKGTVNINQQSLVTFLSNGFLAVSSFWRNLIWRYVFLTFRKDDRPEKTDICYYLGVAYASNLGGAGTLTGTGTNLTFKGIWDTWVFSSFGIIYHMGHEGLQVKLCNSVFCSIASVCRII